MRIGFIGAGKVGVTLGAYLRPVLTVAGYTGRPGRSVEMQAELVGTREFGDAASLLKACDILMLTVPDGQIAPVWRGLPREGLRGKMVCHASGALSSHVFEGADALGVAVGSVHPMYPFSCPDADGQALREAVFTLEGDAAVTTIFQRALTSLGNTVLVIDPANKTHYHLAGVMAANLMTALLHAADDCFIQSGVSSDKTRAVWGPLVRRNLEQVIRQGCAGALTGPVERNDVDTVRAHLAVVPDGYREIYNRLTLILVDIARQKHPGRDYGPMIEALYGESRD